MAKKQEEDEAGPGAPDWIVTFSDMISLLVTFFVLLMTFSSLETEEVLKLTSWLMGTRGALEDMRGDQIQETPEDDWKSPTDPLRGADKPHSRPAEELSENLEEMGQKETPEHVPFDLSSAADGLVIHYDERSSFEPGSVALTAELERSLGELGRVLEHYPYLVVVDGHTDDRFHPTPEWPTEEALSLGRARAAAEALLRQSGLRPELVQIAGHGSKRPRGPNGTAVERRLNRRIEIRVLSLSRLRELNLKNLREAGR